MKYKTIVVIPDLQIPYHDAEMVELVRSFVEDYEPDELWCVGDEIDQPEPSRWNKGMAEEHAGQFWTDVIQTRAIMHSFKMALGDKPFHVMRSNHAERVETYVRRYAPALSSLPDLRIDNMLKYAENGITYHRKMYAGAPGWVLAHGDEGNLRHAAGGTAAALAQKIQSSVVCGHTHRAGIIPKTYGWGGAGEQIVGMEVGHLMDMERASYLKTGTGDWQQAIGLLTVNLDRQATYPELALIQDRKFIVDGYVYG